MLHLNISTMSSSGLIQVHVTQLPSGRRVALAGLPQGSTVGAVKERLARQVPVAVTAMRLLYNGGPLEEDSELLADIPGVGKVDKTCVFYWRKEQKQGRAMPESNL